MRVHYYSKQQVEILKTKSFNVCQKSKSRDEKERPWEGKIAKKKKEKKT